MSTQESGYASIPFSISHAQQNFRLLELPPELVEMIEGGDGDGVERLQLKSSASNDRQTSTNKPSSSKTTLQSPYLHLCGRDKVWAVKQVNTSNSVYVLQPLSSTASSQTQHTDSGHGGDVMELDDIATATSSQMSGVTAISKIGNVLELTPTKIDEREVWERIRDVVPVWEDGESVESNLSRRSVSMRDLYDDIPVPDSLILTACRKLFVFTTTANETSDTSNIGRQRLRPTPALLLESWKALVQTSTISGVKLEQSLDVQSISAAMNKSNTNGQDADTIHEGVVQAIIQHPDLIVHSDASEPDSPTSGTLRSSPPPLSFNAQKVTRFIGRLLLTSRFSDLDSSTNPDFLPDHIQTDINPAQSLSPALFNDDWASILPEAWVEHCSVQELLIPRPDDYLIDLPALSFETVKDQSTGAEIIRLVDTANGTNASGSGSGDLNSTGPKSGPEAASSTAPIALTSSNKRKWHEKFAAQRNARS